ncbi:hypothetical protein C6501_19045 [Candidatus Poribacteria bacterium]|nr:MAG: hypothetical protein C6501_19045 [Candidatus Poribacteria bacterium]
MKTLKLTSIAFAICFLFTIGIHSSHAASITYFYASPWDDYGDGANVNVTVGADEGILFIDWYLNGTYKTTTMYNNGPKWVYEQFSEIPGHIKGEKYELSATVSFVESSDEDASDTFRVYKPIRTSGVGSHTGVDGTAGIGSQYFDSSYNFGMSGWVYVRNDSEHTLIALGWFRQQEWDGENGNFMTEKRDTKDADTRFEPGETYWEYSDSMKLDFSHGRPMEIGEARYFNAHTHLQVSGGIRGRARVDDWEADTRQQTGTTAVKFTEADNP